jgi:hypothetical protein
MRVDNIDFYSADKLSSIIEQRFGQKVELSTLDNDTLQMFKESVQSSMQKFEAAMKFNTGAHNPKYLSDKLLLDAIIKEQESRVKRVQGDKIEIEDPEKPGVTTTIDSDEVDFDTDDAGNITIQSKTNGGNKKTMPKIGAKVSMPEEEGDVEDVVAPEFKKLVHDMQGGMSKEELEKKYPKRKQEIEQLAKDLATVAESMTQAMRGQLGEAFTLGGREQAALRLLVGNQNFSMAKRALEMAKSGQSVPASLMKGFMPVIEKLDTFIRGGAPAVTRFKNLEKIVGRNESSEYADKIKSLLENEMETSEILLASQDIVDQITDMYEKIAEIRSSSMLELVDRINNEMGQEMGQQFKNAVEPTLDSLEQALEQAREGAMGSVAVVKGESPAPMAGDSDIDTDLDTNLGGDDDIEGGDADIEGGDDFGASEPAAGGDEPAGRAER